MAGCAVKFFDGGWFPLVLGLLLFGVMSTWSRGRELLLREHPPRRPRAAALHRRRSTRSTLHRAGRTAVYAVADPATVPQALLHNLKHNQVLHERNVILTVGFREVPWVPADERVEGASRWATASGA